MITIGKTYVFDAAHHLPYHEGKCQNHHGHRFELTVEISGPIQLSGPANGMIMDYAEMDTIIKPWIEFYDHQDLNTIFDNPTSEEMLASLVFSLEEYFPILVSVMLKEGEKTFAKWYNPKFFAKND